MALHDWSGHDTIGVRGFHIHGRILPGAPSHNAPIAPLASGCYICLRM